MYCRGTACSPRVVVGWFFSITRRRNHPQTDDQPNPKRQNKAAAENGRPKRNAKPARVALAPERVCSSPATHAGNIRGQMRNVQLERSSPKHGRVSPCNTKALARSSESKLDDCMRIVPGDNRHGLPGPKILTEKGQNKRSRRSGKQNHRAAGQFERQRSSSKKFM